MHAQGSNQNQSPHYTLTFTVEQSPDTVFDAINNPRAWWSEAIDGITDEVGALFTYRYGDAHRTRFRITELVPGKRVVWHVLDNYFDFVSDQTEWRGTDVVFDIERKGDKTDVRFTHVGLVREFECYDVCSDAWSTYIRGSLRSLITMGQGQPNPLEE
jgi:Activator of Hsp90 ATPase homolog 1-like protein